MHSRSHSSGGRSIDLAQQRPFQLGGLAVEPSLCRVRSGTVHHLEPRVMQVLVVLAEHSPRVVSRDALVQLCWNGRIVGEDAINRVVGRLRKLACADGVERFQIETFKKVGYRLLGQIDRPIFFAGEIAEAAQSEPTAEVRGAAATIPGLAVLRFRQPERGGDEGDLAEGMAEEIIANLTRTPLLRTISPLSSLSYRPAAGGARQACEDLGVRYLVQGQIRCLAGELHLLLTLVAGQSDKTIWSARYRRPIGDLVAVQTELAVEIAGAIGPAILHHEQLEGRRTPPGRDFWNLLIRARFHIWKGKVDDLEQADALLLQALIEEPEDAAALSLLAMASLGQQWSGGCPDPAWFLQKADGYARRALAADNRSAMAFHVMGSVLAQQGAHEQALAAQLRSLELSPGNAQALGELARLMAFGGGDTGQVLSLADSALQLSPNDPHDWLWLWSKAIALFLADRPEQALGAARAAAARRPDYVFLQCIVAACAANAGDMATARSACARIKALSPDDSGREQRLGHPFVHGDDAQRFMAALALAGWDERVQTNDPQTSPQAEGPGARTFWTSSLPRWWRQAT